MSYGEAIRLTELLLGDPSSQLAATRAGWDAPRTREWFVLADLFDLTHQSLTKKPPPYPRPTNAGVRRGQTSRSRSAVIAILNAHGHQIGG